MERGCFVFNVLPYIQCLYDLNVHVIVMIQ